MAARDRLQCADNTRKKIKVSLILKKLTDHVVSDTELSATQVTAAIALLKKVLPDLSAIDLQANVTLRPKLVDLSGGKLTQRMDDGSTDTDS